MSRRAKKLKRLAPPMISLALAAGASRASAQSIYLAKDELNFTAPRLKYLELDAEFEDVSYSSKNGGATDTQRIYFAPAVGIGWNYYVYHPDLLTFSLLAEPSYTWQQYNYAGTTSGQDGLLLNGNFNATLLQLKPYATTFNYTRSHEDYHYDFFNSATVDEESYGAAGGYRQGAVPVTVSVQHTTRDSSGVSLNSTTEQTTASLHAQNNRRKGDYTDLNYQFSQYDSDSTFAQQGFADTSTTHYLALTDVENFKKSALNSSLIYNNQEYQGAASDDLNVMLDYDYQHTERLRSFYDYSFALYSSDVTESLNHRLRVGLQHQLYESLASSADVHASSASSDSFNSTLDQQSAGISASVDYSKRLGEWGHLSASDSASYDFTHQDSTGSQFFVNGESHTVPLNGLFFLNQPLATSVVSIMDSTGVITLIRGTAGDYDVITTGDPWQIQIHSSGPNHIAAGSSVQVNYIVQPNPSGNYSVLNNQFQIRLDFWQGRGGIYARYNFTKNYADSTVFVLEDISEFQAGANVAWKGFRADANYTDRESSLYNYQSITLSESYSLRTSARSTAGIDLREQWSAYSSGRGTNAMQNVTYYSATARYEWHPVASLNWNTEAGIEQQRGAGSDEDLIVARSYLNWFVGKLDVRLGYEFQNQKFPAEIRGRNFVFLRIRRNF